MPDTIEGYLSEFFNSSIFGIPVIYLIIIVIFFILILLIIKNSKPKDDMPKEINPEDELKKEFKDIVDTTGIKVKYRSMLMFGMNSIGRIISWSPYRYEELIPLKDSAKSNQPLHRVRDAIISKEKGLDFLQDNFNLYKIIGRTIFHYIIYIFGNPFNLAKERYFLVDMSFIAKSESIDQFISLDAQPFRFYDSIYVFSQESKKVVQLLTEHLTVKQMLKSDVNRIPLIQYYDMKTAKFVSRADAIRKIKKKSWKDKENNLEKDMPDVDDEDVD